MLRRSLLRALRLPPVATGRAASAPAAVHPFCIPYIEPIAGWCNRLATSDLSSNNDGQVCRQKELKQTTPVKDNDLIIDRIQESTRELKHRPVGRNLSSKKKRKLFQEKANKRKRFVNTLLALQDSEDAVYRTLDAWVAFEQNFPFYSLKEALSVLEKEEQWHRIVRVIKWMLSKEQGNTMGTYELLVRALEKDNRAEEAHEIWQKKIAHDLRSVPWCFCHSMLAIYYRNNMLDRLVKLFKELEACGRKPRSKYIRIVGDAYKMLGLLEHKKALLDKYKDLYNKPSRNDGKKGSKFNSTEMNKTAAESSMQSKMETSENVCPTDKELDVPVKDPLLTMHTIRSEPGRASTCDPHSLSAGLLLVDDVTNGAPLS